MKSDSTWVRIVRPDQIPLREGRLLQVGSLEVAVFNLGDRFLAVENRCPHLGGPLADGIISGDCVVCPLHGWRISLRCGDVESPAQIKARIRTFPTAISDGVLLVEVSA